MKILFAALLVLGLAASAPAAEPIVVRVAALPIDPAGEVLYAQDQGFFKAGGLDVRLTVLANGSAIVAATAAGSVDVGFASVSSVALAHEHGVPVRYFAPAGIYTGPVGNTILLVPKGSPVQSGADLNGKTIGVGGLKDLTQFETETWIDRTGGDSKTVKFVEIRYSEMAAALEGGRLDAACEIEPFVTSAKSTARVVANLSDTMGGAYLTGGWLASEDWLHRNPEAARRFAAVMQRTARWANAHHPQTAAVLLRYAKIPPEIAATMVRARYDERLTVDPALVQRPVDMLAKYGMIAPTPARDLLYTP